MKKTVKRILSIFLCAVMVLGCVPLSALAAQEKSEVSANLEKDGLSVDSTNTIGDILSQSIENQNEENDSSYGIVSAKTKEKYVEVEFVNEQACTLVAALYDDDSGKMLTYALKEVEANEAEATLTFNVAKMPEYYLVRVFLVGDKKQALCDDYSYIEKTHNYVEAQAKTVDDFEGEIIINFDEDKTNNFAVVAENGVEISSSNGYNKLAIVDEENGIYTFANIDKSLSSLKAGEVLCYGDNAENALVLKISKIKISGSTATVWAKKDAEIGELFDFVKTDLQSDGSAAEKSVDVSGVEDGITYEGMEEYVEDDVQQSALIDEEYNGKMYRPVWKVNEKIGNDGELSGTYVEFKFEIKVGVSYKLKMYYDADWEWKWDFWNSYSDYYFFESTFEFFATGTGSVTGVLKKDFYLGELTFATPVGITLGVGFRLAFSASGGISFDAIKISFKLGFRYDADKGFTDNSSSPKIEILPSLKTKVEVSVGIKASPNVGWMKLLELSISPEFGVKAEATVFDVDIIGEITGEEKDEKHDCKLCFDGVIKFYIKAKIVGEIFGKEIGTISLISEKTVDIDDFYWSVTYGEFEFGQKCPHKSYLVTFNVTDSDGKAINKATVTASGNSAETDKKGTAKIYLPNGSYSVSVTCAGYKTATTQVLISNYARELDVKLYKSTETSDPSNPSGEGGLTGSEKTGDIIEFGSYPQSRVTNANLLSALGSQTKTWKSYGCYSGTGSAGTMVQGDWMKYADVTYNGSKYRAVTFSQYRPCYTCYSSSADYTYQDDNGYTTKAVYWFKYEPIKWRVLDPASGLVMCESLIDSQPYSNTVYYSGEYYNDSSYTNYANDYATSSIRAWLNDDFYNTAFSSSQKSQIAVTECNNSCWNSSYPQYNSETTYDKIFLLSYDEVRNSNYGFSSSDSDYDTARRAQGTDYAKCQGLYVSTSSSYYGNSWWWLRSPDDNSYDACAVSGDGTASNPYYYVYCTDGGVRPALRLNLKSSISKSPNKATKVAASKSPATLTLATSIAALFENGTFTLSNTVDGNRYMVYGIKNYSDSTKITSTNLVYINQSQASNGEAVFEYKPSSTASATVVVVGDFGDGTKEKVVTLKDRSELPANLEIKTPSKTTINYGDGIVLHLDVENLPSGAEIVWEASNGNFTYTVSADGKTCTITSKSSGKTTFTATVFDKDGNELSSDTQEMTSKAGFFQKFAAFFKKLFGLLVTYPQSL